MTTANIITIIAVVLGLIFNTAVLLIGAAFAWGKVKATVSGLTGSINRLTKSVEKLDDKLDGHGERLARLEASGGVQG